MGAPDPLEVMTFILGYSDMPSEKWRARWPAWTAQVDKAGKRLDAELAGGRAWAKSDPHVSNAFDAAYRWVFMPLMRECLLAPTPTETPSRDSPALHGV